MHKILHPLLFACVLGCPSLYSAEENETKLTEKDLPAAVLTTMHTAAVGAKLGEFESETKKGKVVYTATFTDAKGVEQEVTVDPSGKLISVEKEDDGDNKESGDKDSDDKKSDTKSIPPKK